MRPATPVLIPEGHGICAECERITAVEPSSVGFHPTIVAHTDREGLDCPGAGEVAILPWAEPSAEAIAWASAIADEKEARDHG